MEGTTKGTKGTKLVTCAVVEADLQVGPAGLARVIDSAGAVVPVETPRPSAGYRGVQDYWAAAGGGWTAAGGGWTATGSFSFTGEWNAE